jgi:hypothetical protein
MRTGRIPAVCGRCGGAIRPGQAWDVGHVQAYALGGGLGFRPEHRSCNRRHGAQLAAALRKRRIEAGFPQSTPVRALIPFREKLLIEGA